MNTNNTTKKMMKNKMIQMILMVVAAILIGAVGTQPVLAEAKTTQSVQLAEISPIGGPQNQAEFETFIDGYLAAQMEAHHIPGVVFTMVKDGEVFYAKGYGTANLADGRAFDTEETMLTTASLAKAFTAVGVLQLYEQGLIDLNEDVRPYFTNFQLDTQFSDPLTFAHLLTHTDGFETRMLGGAALEEDGLIPLEEVLETYMPTQIFPPGRYMTYSDFAANLAGYLTQEISGMSYEQYMVENVLGPLGMADSSFDVRRPLEVRERLAEGYEYENGEQVAMPEFYVRTTPAGGLRTTAADMNRFMLALLNGGSYQGARILAPETVQLMFTRQFSPHPEMGGITYGLFEHLENGQQVFVRDGDGVGTRSRMVLFPDQNLGFFVSYNSGDSSLRLDIISAFLDRYYPSAGSNAVVPMAGYQTRASRYAGTYRIIQADRNSFTKSMFFFAQEISVSASDEGYLVVDPTSGDAFGGFEGPSQWVETAPLVFERVDGSGRLFFVEDSSGNIIRMISEQGYHGTFEKLSWYETQSFHYLLIGLVAVLLVGKVLSTMVLWPLGGLVRWLRGRENHQGMTRLAAAARLWAALTAGVLALFILNVIRVLYAVDAVPGIPNFLWGVSEEMVSALNSLYLPAVLALALPVFTILAWRSGWWKLSARVYYTLVTIAVFAGLWWAHFWNLLGFRM